MKNNKEKKYPTTEKMRTAKLRMTNLNILLDKLLKPQPFWAKLYAIEDILKVQNEISRAESFLWDLAYAEYPELKGKNLSMGYSEIIIT